MADKIKKTSRDEKEELSRFERLKNGILGLIHFLSYDIWRLNPESISNKKNILFNAIKTIMLTVRNVQELNIAASARSLTYRTLLSIVPLLAVIFAIARGFGIENIMQSSIFNLMTGEQVKEETVAAYRENQDSLMLASQEFIAGGIDSVGVTSAINRGIGFQEEASAGDRTKEFLDMLFQIINQSLEEAKGGGVFAGIGILLFLYTILLLFNDIENNFNKIWQVSRGRSIPRKVTDYLAFVLFMPLFFILINALNIISYPQNDTLKIIYILYPFIPRLLDVVPFILIILLFTVLYKLLPNTKVKFQNALIGGAVAGIAFQFFQMLYLSGQLWISRYNAIYGTFAAIPLMLLWIQFSWFIALIGAEISYAAQNVRKFSFEKETRNISRRYKDFFTLMIASEIVKRFANELPPLTADQLSERCQVPLRLTHIILDDLLEVNVISVTPSLHDSRIIAFQPAIDINLITVNYLMSKLDVKGSEDFMIDTDYEFNAHWEVLIESRSAMYNSETDPLLKDLVEEAQKA